MHEKNKNKNILRQKKKAPKNKNKTETQRNTNNCSDFYQNVEDGAAAHLAITVHGPVSLSLLKVRPTPCVFEFGFCSSNLQDNLWHRYLLFSYPAPESLDCPFSPPLDTRTSRAPGPAEGVGSSAC